MKPEMVPYKTLRRNGYTLVAFRQAALPIFWSRARFLSIGRKRIGPIPEFVLKCIGAGLSDVASIASLLGISEELAVEALHELLNLDAAYVGTTVDGSQQGLVLSHLGRELLAHAEVTVVEEQSVQFPMDAMTRRYCAVERNQLLSGSDMESLGHLELPATPNHKPTPAEVEAGLRTFYLDAARKDKATYDISEVLSVDRSDRLFRDDAYVLYYRSGDDTLDYGIYVGDRASSEHEEAARTWDVLSAKLILPSKIKNAMHIHRNVLTLLCGVTDSARSNLEAVDPFHLSRLVRDAINKASSRILIASSRISNAIISIEFASALESALKKDVSIYIAYDASAIRKPGSCDEALRRLEGLKNKYGNMVLVPQNAAGSGVLVCDDKYAVVSHMDILGYLGQGDVPSVDELGYYWNQQPGINRLFDYVAKPRKT